MTTKQTPGKLMHFVGQPNTPEVRKQILDTIHSNTTDTDVCYEIVLECRTDTEDKIRGIYCQALLSDVQKWVLLTMAEDCAKEHTLASLVRSNYLQHEHLKPRWIRSDRASLYLGSVIQALEKRGNITKVEGKKAWKL